MNHNDMPPLYTHNSHSSAHPVPVYTELANNYERVLHRSSSTPQAPRDLTNSREYKYRTDNAEIDLGPCPWGLLYAAYGRGGSVKGLVTFTKKCNSVLQVTAKLEGIITITTSENTMIGVNKRTFTSQTLILFTSGLGSSVSAGSKMPFALFFPEHTTDGNFHLPPSSSAFHPGASAEVAYTVQIDIVRGTFYRHEMRAIPVLYLPKSSPALPPLVEMPMGMPGPNLPEGTKRVVVPAVWPDTAGVPSSERSDLACVQVYIPDPSAFASGESIPIAISIKCTDSPAIPKMLSNNIGVFLIKRKKIWIKDGRQISVREIVVEKVNEIRMNSLQEGAVYLTMNLQSGQHGSECSWGIDRLMVVEYCIRVIIRPPSYASHLPVFKHDEVVQICTDSYGTLERELLAMDGTPMPALGITTMSTSAAALRGTH